jgi:hypothetical protein
VSATATLHLCDTTGLDPHSQNVGLADAQLGSLSLELGIQTWGHPGRDRDAPLQLGF